MWNLKDIEKKRKYIIERLNTCKDKEEKEKLELTHISYVGMLNNSGTFRYTRLYNFLDFLTDGKFTLVKESKYTKIGKGLICENKDYIDEDYLKFLINITKQIALNYDMYNEEEIVFKTINMSDDEIYQIIIDFYDSFGDKEIKDFALKIIKDKDSINFTKYMRNKWEDVGGITFYDHIFKKPYIMIVKENTIMNLPILTHEIMHGIDFYFNPKLFSKEYRGFHEIPTYTIDFLFRDYLKDRNTNYQEIIKLEKERIQYFVTLAVMTLYQLEQLIKNKTGVLFKDLEEITNLSDFINMKILKNLLDLESFVISYALYEQIKQDRKKGIKNLKSIMKSDIAKDKRPDFSFIGLDDEKILEFAKKIKNLGKIQIDNLKK